MMSLDNVFGKDERRGCVERRGARASTQEPTRWRSCASSRSTASPSRSSTRTAVRARRPAATGASARTSRERRTIASVPPSRLGQASRGGRGAGRGLHAAHGLRGAQRSRQMGEPSSVRSPTSRNAAAGSLRQKDPASPPRELALCYQLGQVEGGPLDDPPRDARLVARARLPGQRRDHALSRPRRRAGLPRPAARHRHDLDYEIDGVVVKVDDLATATSFGVRSSRRAGRSPTSSRPRRRPRSRNITGESGARGELRRRTARAGLRRRRHGRPRDAAQRGRGRPQGRTHRRHGDRAQAAT